MQTQIHCRSRLLVGLAFSFVAALLVVFSYFNVLSCTVFDATVASEKGVISLQIPLTKLAGGKDLRNDLRFFRRTSADSRKMVSGQRPWGNGFGFAGFGYSRGSWLYESRPGPFLELYVPIWFLFLMLYVWLFARPDGVQFRLRSMLWLTTLVAASAWLLTLREPGG
ncbi:hypothetical protein [Crateriforma spongiae]|uniref:hypothetical protein n=1 Tax=Crateriforma spongiae TaxID=2724528 RepID=UPI0039B061A6